MAKSRKVVTFEKLSKFQRKDCINRQGDYKCPNPAVQEAVLEHDIYTARIRCCRDEACAKVAHDLAFTCLGLRVPKK